jgi:hypothetical protein
VVHTRVTASEAQMLTPEEFASLLTVGNTPAVNCPPEVIPAEHSARLIALGYMVDLAGRLRMTTPGRIRIYAGNSLAEADYRLRSKRATLRSSCHSSTLAASSSSEKKS